MSKGDKNENLSPEEYLDMVRPYLRDLINNHKTPMKLPNKVIDETKLGELKIQLIMLNNCISSKKFEETCFIYSASIPIEIVMVSDTNNIIDELFRTLLERFQTTIILALAMGKHLGIGWVTTPASVMKEQV